MDFMSWTLKRPTSAQFNQYKKLADGEPWNSKNFITVDSDAPINWSVGARSFVETIERHNDKINAIGMHEFGVSDNGNIFNNGFGEIMYPNGWKFSNPNYRVLSEDETQIENPVPTSLRYLMHTYPHIRWSIQLLATSNSSGDRVTPILNNERKPLFTAISNGTDEKGKELPWTFEPKTDSNGNIIYVNAQDEFIRQAYLVCLRYIEAGYPIADVEIDFEKANSKDGEDKLFADLLERVSREVAKPLGLGLRVNLLAMTGDYNPSYYGWHNYATIASRGVVDEYQLMSYDFSWGGSAPGPSTPLWWLENILKHVRDLEQRGLWRAEQVYIGNAGYGRRWTLGEDRMGVTLDYKQLMQLQNGEWVHNDGATNADGNFYFRNQDFIPFTGFNDPDSDYQITYPQVYDRFTLDTNGGSSTVKVKTGEDTNGNDLLISSVNRPAGTNYVTSYSRRQYAEFTGVVDRVTKPTEKVGLTNKLEGSVGGYNVTGMPDMVGEKWVALKSENESEADGQLIYRMQATGTYKVVALVVMPFYTSANLDLTVNGKSARISGTEKDWYPYIQKEHFAEVGTFTFDGEAEIVVGVTNGMHIGGFVICEDFNHGLRGGSVDFPVSTYPFKRRGEIESNGTVNIVDAQFPETMQLVGEILRRPPRPAIIWEDIFASYLSDTKPTWDIVGGGNYYNGDRTKGEWIAQQPTGEIAHAYNDSPNGNSQLVLNNPFNGNIMLDVEMAVNRADSKAKYGLRILADKGTKSGYLFLLDFEAKKIRLIWEDPSTGARTEEKTLDMSQSLANGLGSRYSIRAYYLNGVLSCWVGERAYIDRYKPRHTPTGGAYGIYNERASLKVYKYHIASLDRFEPMEKLRIEVEGDRTYEFGNVPRNVPTDEFGYLIFTGYPADLQETVSTPSDSEGGGNVEVAGTGTIIETEVKAEEWKLDYKNVRLADIASFIGKRNIRVTMLDAGIWFRRFYVGDSEGMSIAYNSDKAGFIRTAEMVNDYNCKGIAMWTIGQEDPTVYTYLTKTN